jgi:modulator of FtsH protease HflC
MASRLPLLLFGLLALVLLAWSCMFQVRETEVAIRTELGKIVGTDYGPGLHFKLPLINKIHRFERRIVTQPYEGETFLTSENKALIVDFYVKWRVQDPAKYFTTTQGIEAFASSRLGDNVKDGIKGRAHRLHRRHVQPRQRLAAGAGHRADRRAHPAHRLAG